MEIHAQTLNRFFNQHKIIKHYIDDLPPQAINDRLNPGKWSIHETIAYLCRYQYVFMDRLKTILSEINPSFEVYGPDDDPEYRFTVARSSGSLLHEIYRIREDMTVMLENLSVPDCSRVGTHAILGKMNICQWLEFFLLHESNQLYKIFKLSCNFWSADHSYHENAIITPELQDKVDELAG